MTIPAGPTPDLILIQPDLPFGLLKALCDGPAAADPLDHGREGRRLRGTHDVCGALGRVAETPTDQEPPTPVRLARRSQWEPSPVIPSGAFGPVTSPQATPALLLQHRQEGFDLPLATGTPDIFFPRDGQDIRVGMRFQPVPQRSMIPIHTLAGHPG